jgi:DUF4097 and DUF4098 domain-containing protein YvlB
MLFRRPVPPLGLLALLALAFAGCGLSNLNNRFTAEETESKSFTTKEAPRVIAETFNGGIDITTGAEGTVKASVIKRASGSSQDAAEDNLDTIEVSMKQEGDEIRIKAFVKENKLFSSRGARVTLQVPPGTFLDLHTSNGRIAALGQTGDVRGESSNGEIEVKGGSGKLHLTTSNGPINVEGGSGRLSLHTSNGLINVKAEDVAVDAHTSNGAIHFKGSLAGGEHVFDTHNGGVVLVLPADAQFRVDGQTSNGKIVSDFQVKQGQKKRRAELHGTVGKNPAATIKIHTSNGAIELRREPNQD